MVKIVKKNDSLVRRVLWNAYNRRCFYCNEVLLFNNFLKINSGLPVSGVAREGSRRRGTHQDRSDLDVIFAISGDPSKREIYPSLVELLESTMNLQARIGSSYNAIKIQKEQLRCDLVLKTQTQFQAQINNRQYEEI